MKRTDLALGAFALCLLVLTWASVLLVDPAEVAVIYRFGAVQRTANAGLSFVLPGIERAERIRVTEVRRVQLPRAHLLTGDTNLVEVALIAQFSVEDPVAFALRMEDPEQVVAAEVTAVTAALVSRMDVDTLLTTGRAGLQLEVLEAARASLKTLGAGVTVVAIEVGELAPPAAVVNAFNDVSSARGDQDTMRLAADAYASKVLSDVRGRAAALTEKALGEASSQTARVDGDIARFESQRAAWRAAPASVRAQLREELLEEIGPRMEVRVVSPGSEVYLP